MKVAYLIDGDLDLDSPNSVAEKVLAKTSYWVMFGCKVYIYSLKNGVKYDVNNKKLEKLSSGYNHTDNALNKLVQTYKTTFIIFRDLMVNNVDVIYSRYLLYTPFLSRIFSANYVVMEINSNDISEYKRYSLFSELYNRITRRLLISKVNLFFCVSGELKEYISLSVGFKEGTEVEVIANGIRFDDCKPKKTNIIRYEEAVSDSVDFVFVASGSNYSHGLDLILELAKEMPDYRFNIIGLKGESMGNVIYHGPVYGESLIKLLSKASIGISSLASFRHGMLEASPLKSRLYFQSGLLVIGNYFDTDMYDSLSYLQVSTPCSAKKCAEEISNFLNRARSLKLKRIDVIEEARRKISMENKEMTRVKIIKSRLK